MDIEKLKQMRNDGISNKEIIKYFDISQSILEKLITKHNLGKQNKIELSEEDIRWIKAMIFQGTTQKEIAAKFGIGLTAFQQFCKRNNIATKNYTVVHNYFSVINNEEKAYFLGLLYADGYNAEFRNQIKLKLHKQDKAILELFASKLTIGNLPSFYNEINGTNTLSLQLTSKQLCQDLKLLGCMQAKSLILQLPILEKELMRHFIRGYFDGDGSIFLKERPKTKSNYHAISFTGCELFISQLNNYLINELGLGKINIVKQNKLGNAFHICYTKYEDIKKLRNYFYNNSNSSLRLERKFNKFPSDEILNDIIKNKKEIKSNKISESFKQKRKSKQLLFGTQGNIENNNEIKEIFMNAADNHLLSDKGFIMPRIDAIHWPSEIDNIK